MRIATGPQAVTISVDDGNGRFYIEDTVGGPAPAAGLAGVPFRTASMALDDGQDLYIRGTGVLVIISQTQVV